jgi:hypothetical protein
LALELGLELGLDKHHGCINSVGHTDEVRVAMKMSFVLGLGLGDRNRDIVRG